MSNISEKFDSRETYQQWVKQWKLEYKELSVLIRETKKIIANGQKNGEYMGNKMMSREFLRLRARNMLQSRADGKEESQRQYLAQQLETV